MAYEPPTADELRRVAAHWQRVQALSCTHEEITFTYDQVKCGRCDRPVRILSDIQIENLRTT